MTVCWASAETIERTATHSGSRIGETVGLSKPGVTATASERRSTGMS